MKNSIATIKANHVLEIIHEVERMELLEPEALESLRKDLAEYGYELLEQLKNELEKLS